MTEKDKAVLNWARRVGLVPSHDDFEECEVVSSTPLSEVAQAIVEDWSEVVPD
jgi:hypothetical protein